jgi:putative transposase
MARPLRIVFPGAFYHVMARGNARTRIYCDERDNRRFLEILEEVRARFEVVCHAFCLMENHYHLVVETPAGNLSAAIRHLNGVYAQWSNNARERCGHMFQGRFKAQLVQKERYLRSVCRYVVLNPRRAGLVRHPADWPWSSYRACAGLDEPPLFLSTALVHSLCASAREVSPMKAYARFVLGAEDELDIGHAIRKDDRFIGEESFWEAVRSACAPDPIREIPRRDYLQLAPPLADLLEARRPLTLRNRSIRLASAEFGYSAVDMASHLGLNPETVRRVLRARWRPLPPRQMLRTGGNALGVCADGGGGGERDEASETRRLPGQNVVF